jgi:acyl-CoA synthetase (NDP forming)
MMLSPKLFPPKSVAVQGGSRNPGMMGHGVFTHPVGS